VEATSEGHKFEKPLTDSAIDTKLNAECVAILKPYSEANGRGSIFVLETILEVHKLVNTLDHSISVGILCGALFQKYYAPIYPRINFFTGYIPSLVHDVGKYERSKIYNNPKKLDATERVQIKDHVHDTLNILSDYPMLIRLVGVHHLSGQPDGIPYPDDIHESNTHIISLGRTLSIADKASASVEIRPELTPAEIEKRQTHTGINEQINRLHKWFEPEDSRLIDKEIDYIQKIIFQNIVLTPFNPDKKIPIYDAGFTNELIENGFLSPDLSCLKFKILKVHDRGYNKIKMATLLAELTKPRTGYQCKVSFSDDIIS